MRTKASLMPFRGKPDTSPRVRVIKLQLLESHSNAHYRLTATWCSLRQGFVDTCRCSCRQNCRVSSCMCMFRGCSPVALRPRSLAGCLSGGCLTNQLQPAATSKPICRHSWSQNNCSGMLVISWPHCISMTGSHDQLITSSCNAQHH